MFHTEALDASLGEGGEQQGAQESCSEGSVQSRLEAGEAGGQVREARQSHGMRGEPQCGGGARQARMPELGHRQSLKEDDGEEDVRSQVWVRYPKTMCVINRKRLSQGRGQGRWRGGGRRSVVPVGPDSQMGACGRQLMCTPGAPGGGDREGGLRASWTPERRPELRGRSCREKEGREPGSEPWRIRKR